MESWSNDRDQEPIVEELDQLLADKGMGHLRIERTHNFFKEKIEKK